MEWISPFTARVNDGVLWGGSQLLSLLMKSSSVTIQMKPLQQFFHMVLFI